MGFAYRSFFLVSLRPLGMVIRLIIRQSLIIWIPQKSPRRCCGVVLVVAARELIASSYTHRCRTVSDLGTDMERKSMGTGGSVNLSASMMCANLTELALELA